MSLENENVKSQVYSNMCYCIDLNNHQSLRPRLHCQLNVTQFRFFAHM